MRVLARGRESECANVADLHCLRERVWNIEKGRGGSMYWPLREVIRCPSEDGRCCRLRSVIAQLVIFCYWIRLICSCIRNQVLGYRLRRPTSAHWLHISTEQECASPNTTWKPNRDSFQRVVCASRDSGYYWYLIPNLPSISLHIRLT